MCEGNGLEEKGGRGKKVTVLTTTTAANSLPSQLNIKTHFNNKNMDSKNTTMIKSIEREREEWE